MIRPLYGRPGLARPSAASVPSVVARMVARDADDEAVADRAAATCRWKKSWYQRSDRPGMRVGEVGLGVERQRDDHQDRRDQEQQHQAADDVEAVVPGCGRAGRRRAGSAAISRASCCRCRRCDCRACTSRARRPAGSPPMRRGEAPVERALRVVGDEVADHLVGRAADQGRRDVVAERQDEDQDAARPDAGHGLREVDPPEGGERRARPGSARRACRPARSSS